jgi:hypothetical protein
VERIF